MTVTTGQKGYVARARRLGVEFVVIVLGVLAAFAVEGWSEQRENARREHDYLLRLQEDLARDLEQIKVSRWAAFAKTRAATTLLYELGDPLAADVPAMTERAKSIDFSVPATEVISVEHLGDLVWVAYRDRTLQPSRSTYDEMIATGRFLVIRDPLLRTSIIEHYTSLDGADWLAEWIAEGSDRLEQVLAPTGMIPFEFQNVPEPLPQLKELDGLGLALRDLRWRAMRHVYLLEDTERRTKALSGMIDEQLADH